MATDICRLPRGPAIVNDGISSARHRLLVILTVVLATGSMVVEATIINVAIPAIMRQFSISTEDAQWLSTGFLGAMVTTMLLAGVVSPNRRKFRQPNSSPATIASRSMTWPSP